MVCSWLCPLSIILLTGLHAFSFTYKFKAMAQPNIITCRVAVSYTKHRILNSKLSSFKAQRKEEEFTMIRAKRIAQMAKRWQKMVALGRKHLTWETTLESDEHCTSVSGKGHCVVYTTDGKRFEVPLAYLGKKVFEEFLRMSQEEFGFTSEGRIILPCDAATMEYAMCLLRRSISEEVENALLSTMVVPCHYGSCLATSVGISQQITVWSS